MRDRLEAIGVTRLTILEAFGDAHRRCAIPTPPSPLHDDPAERLLRALFGCIDNHDAPGEDA